MSGKDVEIVALLIGAIIGLVLFLKFWRAFIAIAFVGGIGFVVVKLVNNQTVPLPNTPQIPAPNMSSNARPDLTVNISWYISAPFSCDSRSDKYHMQVDIVNEGQSNARNVIVAGPLGYQTNIPLLEAGKHHTMIIQPGPRMRKLHPRGTGMSRVNFVFTADPNNHIFESNENNNRSQTAVLECF